MADKVHAEETLDLSVFALMDFLEKHIGSNDKITVCEVRGPNGELLDNVALKTDYFGNLYIQLS